ncbi:MAG: InlB B-repeat-containing protein [Paludibacteraceae bacterium]|nr:InlB B-repeat-containing protein [Paludibacteraceae bacterium]
MKNLFLTKTRWLVTIILLTALGIGNVWGAKITDYNNIVSGTEYYIGATTSSSSSTDYYWCSPQTTTGTGVSGTAVTSKASATIVILEGSGTSWKIKIKGTSNYVTLSSSKANGKFNIAESSDNWTFSNANNLIKMLYTESYCLQKNNSGTQFGSYGGTQANVWLEEAAPEYTITATRNNDSYGTVEVSGTTITATPAAGYRVIAGNDGYTVTSGSATVVNNGDNTFTVTPSSNCTVQINFEAIPKYTVTLKDNGDKCTQASAGASVTLPVRAGCAGYTFAGWTKTWVTDQTEWTTTAPTIIPAGSYTPTANENLYPVYTKEEGGGTADDSKTETFEKQTAGTTYNSTQTYTTANSNAGIAWTMYYGTVSTNAVLTGSKSAQMRWYSSAKSNYPYIKTTTAVSGLQTLTFNAAVGNTNIKMKVEKSTDGSNWTTVASNVAMATAKTEYSYSISGTLGTDYYIRIGVDGTNSTAPSSGNYTFRVDDVKFDYQTGGGSTTYYISEANCCTPLGSINGSINVNSTSATLTWDNIANVSSWAVACKNTSTGIAAGTVGSITTNGAGKKTCTITNLTCGGTGYTFTISATAASGYCDKSWELTGSTTACTDPAITVSPASLSGFTYVVNNGPSDAQNFTVSGLNLTGDLTVKAPMNYQVSTDGGNTWSTSGGTKTISVTPPTLSSTTVKVRLASGLSRGTYNDAIGVKIYGGGVDEANAKTVSLAGNVTNAFHTVTISAGANGSVSPSGAQSVEEGQTLEVTATPDPGYRFSSWTVTGAGSSCTGSTFTMGTADATLQANFAQIMVSGITVNGDATVKTLASTTYTATVSPAEALTKTVSWSVINGTGTATINSLTGELTAGSPGTVTVRATATDGSGVYGELAVTIQDAVRYKFVKMTSTPSPWEDDEYLIVHENNATSGSILKASDPLGSSDPSTGVGATKSVTITSSTITLEDDKDDAVHISYVDTKGYLVQAVGGYRQYIVQNGTTVGGSSMKTLASDNTTNTRYWSSIAHNLLKYQTTYNIAYNSNSFRFYSNNYTSSVVLYRLERSYTVTCNTPSNGTLTSDMGNAASGTTVTLTVTPSGGYELNTLTITTDGGETVTPTKVDETHYTFTMPKDNVTVEATFKTEVAHTLHFNVPTCVTAPDDITGKTTGSTVTMPSEPAGTPDGYTFVGWALAAQESPVAVQPTTIAPGSYKVPSGEVTLQYYALYSEGELSVSGTFSNITTLGNVTAGDYYIISNLNNSSAAILTNTLSGNHIASTTTNPGSCSNANVVWQITKPDSYWRIQNISTKTYVAGTGVAKEATLIADASSDAAKWTLTATAAGYRMENLLDNNNSITQKFLSYSASAGDYRTLNTGNGGDVLYLYKAAVGTVTDNTTYTTDPSCFCEYRLLKSTNSGSNWEEVGCFTKVKPSDANDHEWQLANFEMPAYNSSTLLKVQREGYDYYGQTVAWQSGWIPLAELQGGICSYKAFELEGAVGTLRIYDVEGGNSVEANSNFYLGFYPTYQITHGVEGGGAWTNESFELVDAGTHKYQTAVTTAPAGYFANANYKFYVGARKSDGSTKFAEKNDGKATAKSNTQKMNTMGGMTSDVGGRSGVYQLYSNSCDQNWYCTFIPYYVVYYHDVNGNEIVEWRDVLTSPTTTVHEYASGQTGWATSLGGGANATYNAGASITPAADIHLYQVASTYTVTYSVASETSAYNGTSVKVIQGQSVTLPTITFSCGLYDTHVGWVTGSDIPELEPAAKIDEPSTLVGAPGASFTPTADVTLKALYGYECDGNAGWQKQTTISAGTYFMFSPGPTSGKVLTGWSSSGGTVESGYTTDVPTKFDSKPSNAIIITIDSDGRMSWGDNYAVVADKDLDYTNVKADATLWTITASGYIKGVLNATDYYIQTPNSGTVYFKCYTGTQTNYAYLYKYIKTGYYTTNPTCEVPTKLTVTFNANSPTGDAGDVSNMPTTIVRDFSSYPTLSSAINFNSNPTPTCDGYTIQKWNTAANGSGTDYALDATISTYSGSSLPLYAIWDRTYTVSFNNQGTITPVTQASAGASVDVPSATSPCSVEWAFVGWSETAIAPMSFLPTLEITAGEGTYTPTADKTLYAIYRKTSESSPFVAGMSGAYKISNGGTVYAGAASTKLAETDAARAVTYYITYTAADGGKYTIQRNDGKYIAYSGSSTELALDDETPYYWTMTKNGDLWRVFAMSSIDRYLQYSSGTGFKAYNYNTTSNTLAFVAAEGEYYYRTMSCADEFDITFHNNGTTINWAGGYPEAAYKDLADATVVSTFPTATFDGWTFIGWRQADYTESTSAPASSGIYGGSNGTSGNTLTIASANVDLYPVFTRFEDNEPFDLINGGDYYIYFLESGSNDGYDGEKRVYAASYDGALRYNSSALCSEATTFTFTKLDNGNWTIYDNTTKKYLYGIENDGLKQQASATGAEWTLTVNGNQFDAFHVGTSYGQITAYGDGESATFMNYSRNNLKSNPGLYHRVYLGSCTNRTFTTNPSTTPNIEIHGQVKVTSTAGKSIKSTSVLTVSASNIATANLTVTSNNGAFKFSLTSNGAYTASVNIPVVSNKVGVTPIYVEYTPTEITNGIEEATITVSDGDVTPTEVSTESGDVQGRHVPANFVIAAKWGDKWYALPANCTESTSSTTGVLIEVDNASDPTRATAAPSYTKWGLQTVRQSRKPDYGSRLVFTEQLTTATADDQKTLYNGSTTSIQANAMYQYYMGDATEKYEWIPTTTDLKDYILTSATTLSGDASARTVSLSNKGVFGTLLMNKSNDGKVRILPAEFYEPVEMQVIEWKANSLVVMYGGAGIKATTQVGNNDPSSLQTLASAKVDHAVYELSTSQALTNSTNMPLTITVKNGSDVTTGTCALIVPAIVTGAQDAPLGLTADEATLTDVVVTDGATLSAVATKYTFKNITVYPGGKLVIGSGKQLGMASLTLRGGSSWGAATYEHKYPQFVVNNATSGAYSNTSGVINYDYVTTKDQYYSFVLPYAGNTGTIKYPVDIYGRALESGSQASFEFQYYDGAARAAGGTGWKVLAEPATLVAGTGYTFLGMPRKVDAYDGTDDSHANTRQRYGIHRIPMSVAAATVQAGETNSAPGKATPIRVTLASKNNNSGWALVGNPYLSNVSGLSNTDIQVGKLVHTDTNPWDGKWQWDDTNLATGVRYIVTTDDGQNFESQQAITATLKAFQNFFVQIHNGGATSLVIPANTRTDKDLAPARYMADVEQDIQLAVDLVSETRSDKVDLLINDIYTAEFDQDGDFTKMMNTTKFNLYGVYPGDNLSFIAVDKTTAAGSIAIGYQVPAAGEYTLQLSERPYVMSDYVETLLVTDHEVSPEVTTDLLENPYSFTVTKAETNDARFTVSIKLKENQDTPTDIDIINGGGDLDGEKPIKFIYHDKMYILRNGVLYDATGKKVREINK